MLILCDTNPDLCEEWHKVFDGNGDFKIICGSAFAVPDRVDAIVSPANSFGFMDGSFDYFLTQRFGLCVQEYFQDAITRSPYTGELLVGQVLPIPTHDRTIPYVLAAPTMRVPMILGANTINPFLAFKAIVQYWIHGEVSLENIVVPGLGTGVGKVPYKLCAEQMLRAYKAIIRKYRPSTWHEAVRWQLELTNQEFRDLQK